MAYITNIEEDTLDNDNFRKVVFTSSNPKGMQMTLMSLKPGEEIGLEIHPKIDQFLRFESGKGEVLFGKTQTKVYEIEDGDAVIIPAGTWHNVINTSKTKELKLYSIYTPPQHPEGLVQKKKPKRD